MIRATYGVTASTSVSVGRIISSRLSHGRAPGAMNVTAGRNAGEDRRREQHDQA